jgi:hypothetical protein
MGEPVNTREIKRFAHEFLIFSHGATRDEIDRVLASADLDTQAKVGAALDERDSRRAKSILAYGLDATIVHDCASQMISDMGLSNHADQGVFFSLACHEIGTRRGHHASILLSEASLALEGLLPFGAVERFINSGLASQTFIDEIASRVPKKRSKGRPRAIDRYQKEYAIRLLWLRGWRRGDKVEAIVADLMDKAGPIGVSRKTAFKYQPGITSEAIILGD